MATKKTSTRSTASAKKKTSTRKKAAPKKTAAKQAAPKTTEAVQQQPEYIRNLTGTDFNIRFDSQEGKRRTELKRRGLRGDTAKIKPEDLADEALLTNLNIGAIELLTQEEAAEVFTKQVTNQQQVHSPLSVLRNELDEPYAEGAVKTEQVYEDQGTVVGNVYVEGKTVTTVRGADAPERAAVPGSVDNVPAGRAEQARQDAIARQKDIHGPQAGLPSDIKVSVDPVQKS